MRSAGDPSVYDVNIYRAIRERNREMALEAARREYNPERPDFTLGIALLLGRRDDVLRKIENWPYWLYTGNGREQRQVTRAEFEAAGGVLDHEVGRIMLKYHVAAGLWQPLPPHKKTTDRDILGDNYRYRSRIIAAFISRNPRKVANAIRLAEKNLDYFLAYAIACEAKRIGIDHKVKKFDF
jgi:hypothetical protein